MAQSRDADEYSWYRPQFRGVMPLDGFHVSRSLRRFLRQRQSRLRFAYDENFAAVIDACAAREETWINATICEAFLLLHHEGYAHSAEVYLDGALMGGVYGLALGGAFFGESMFSHHENGSKLALGAMIGDLRARGFALYDTQYLTDHLASLGGVEIPDFDYQTRLEHALHLAPRPISPGAFAGVSYFPGLEIPHHQKWDD